MTICDTPATNSICPNIQKIYGISMHIENLYTKIYKNIQEIFICFLPHNRLVASSTLAGSTTYFKDLWRFVHKSSFLVLFLYLSKIIY